KIRRYFQHIPISLSTLRVQTAHGTRYGLNSLTDGVRDTRKAGSRCLGDRCDRPAGNSEGRRLDLGDWSGGLQL
ncbi:hypothetical protein LTR03_018289, partial [Friedmanniomyces endolithicus]